MNQSIENSYYNYPEIDAYEKLPDFIKSNLCRTEFKEKLDFRMQHYVEKVRAQLSTFSLCINDYHLNLQGDWHRSGSTAILTHKKNKNRLVIKQRSSKAELFIQELLCNLKQDLGYVFYVPKINPGSNVYIQSYETSIEENKSHNELLGSLFALTYWFGIFDLHKENIIKTNSGFAIIDAECLLYNRVGINAVQRFWMSGLYYSKKNVAHSLSSYSLFVPGNLDIELILKGWRNTLNWLIDNKNQLSYETFDEIPIRRLALSTHVYITFLQCRYLYGWSESKAYEKWKNLNKSRPVEEVVIREYEDLKNWYIPYFYQVENEIYQQNNSEPLPLKKKVPLAQSYLRYHKRLSKINQSKSDDLIVNFIKKNIIPIHTTQKSLSLL